MNASRQDKAPVVISGSSPTGTATALVFARAEPKVVIASRRESEREAVARRAENRSGKGLFIKTRAARKAGMNALVEKTLKIGDSAPDFILPDTHGNAVRLYSLLRAAHVVVVFYRGSWCPYCDLHLRGFQRRLVELCELGAQVVAISPQLAGDLLSAQIKSQLALPMLSDHGDKVIRQFGLIVQGNSHLLELYGLFGHRLEYANGQADKKDMPVAARFS